MARDFKAGLRPARITALVQAILYASLAVSFFSGALVWRGEILQGTSDETPGWFQAALTTHGSLNPLLCVLFGYLVAQHIRVQWAARANRVSGLGFALVYGALIATGAGLYYAGDERVRDYVVWSHRFLGLLLPAALALHLWRSRAARTRALGRL